jgi:hypothetical protein
MNRLVFLALLSLGIAAPQSDAPHIKKLVAGGPLPGLEEKLALFGQFVGDWEFDMTLFKQDGTRRTGRGEWHFGWALAGRAIQDVWIAWDDTSRPNAPPTEYGTTVRFYDSKVDAWRVVWVGPMRHNLITFTGRKVGSEIVMEADSRPSSSQRHRWILSEISSQSFHWRAVTSLDEGKNWILEQEMNVRRLKKQQ